MLLDSNKKNFSMSRKEMAFSGSSSGYKKMNNFLNSSDPGFKNNLRVLVVDDDKMVRNITMAMLRTLKVEGKEAVNGKEAVDLFIAGENFNLVLMDREMPVMTGLEVVVSSLKLTLKKFRLSLLFSRQVWTQID